MCAAVAVDAALHAYDSLRRGPRSSAAALIDARPKAARRRHSQARSAPIETR